MDSRRQHRRSFGCTNGGFERDVVDLIRRHLAAPRVDVPHNVDANVAAVAREARTIARPSQLAIPPTHDVHVGLAGPFRHREHALRQRLAILLRENASVVGQPNESIAAGAHAFLSGSMSVSPFTTAGAAVTLW